MNSPFICLAEPDLVPGIVKSMLQHSLQLVHFALSNHFFHLQLGFVGALGLAIMSLHGGNIAAPANLFDIPCPGFVLAAEQIRLLCVALDKGTAEDKVDAPVNFSLCCRSHMNPVSGSLT